MHLPTGLARRVVPHYSNEKHGHGREREGTQGMGAEENCEGENTDPRKGGDGDDSNEFHGIRGFKSLCFVTFNTHERGQKLQKNRSKVWNGFLP